MEKGSRNRRKPAVVTLLAALSLTTFWPLQELFQPLLDFRARQGALLEPCVALRQHSSVKRNAELHDRTVVWFGVQHGKQRVLGLGKLAGALVVLHQHRVGARRQSRSF